MNYYKDIVFHENDLSQFTFLVTGGAGFIGSHIVEYLLTHNAKHIRILDDLSNGFHQNISEFLKDKRVEFIEGDIKNFETCLKACDGIDFVSHQAALGSVPRSIKFPRDTNAANVDGFLNIITAAKEKGVKRLVYASSSSVYGDSTNLPKVEQITGNLLSPYAVSKYVNELYAGVFNRVYGVEIMGLRYFNIFGPRQNPKGPYAAAIPLFMEALLSNQSPKIYGDGEQTRDFTFVQNAVQANIKALFTTNKDALGKVFNIAVGDRVSVNQMFEIVKQATNATVSPEHFPERLGDIRDSLANISLAENLLDYNPKVKFQEGIVNTLAWFKEFLKNQY
jgi:UDP-N-acetylglucosamine/UDP-N-acetylgalactosamine 4-epimerase